MQHVIVHGSGAGTGRSRPVSALDSPAGTAGRLLRAARAVVFPFLAGLSVMTPAPVSAGEPDPVGMVRDAFNVLLPENLYGNSVDSNAQDRRWLGTRNSLTVRGLSQVRQSVYGAYPITGDAFENTVRIQGQSSAGWGTALGGPGGSVYGGYVDSIGGGNAEGNKVFLEDSAWVIADGSDNGSVYGGFSDGAGHVTRNQVTLQGSSKVENSVFGGYSRNGGEVRDNEVFLIYSNSLNLQGWVYGGYSEQGAVKGNKIHLQGSTGSVQAFYGGAIGNGGVVEENQIILYGFQQVRAEYDGLYGGITFGGGSVLNNSVVFQAGSQVTNVYGGYAMGEAESALIEGNRIDIASSNAKNLYGGYAEGPGTVGRNTVDIANSRFDAAYGGYAARYLEGSQHKAGHVVGNVINVHSQEYNFNPDARYYGGYSEGAHYDLAIFGEVVGNTATLYDGRVSGEVYGGYTEGTARASGNTVALRSGQADAAAALRIYGGYSRYGLAEGNVVDIRGARTGAATHIHGGYGDGVGDARANEVRLVSARIEGNVHGGYTGTGYGVDGNAIGNTVSLDASHVVGHVYGGFSERASATGNTVYVNNSTVEGRVYGGFAASGNNSSSTTGHATGNTVRVAGAGSYAGVFGGSNTAQGSPPGPRGPSPIYDLDCFTGNVLYKESEASVIGEAGSFERIVFEYSGIANIGTLDVTPYIIDDVAYMSGGYPRAVIDTGVHDVDMTGTSLYSQDDLWTMTKEGAGRLTTASLDWGHIHLKEGTWRHTLAYNAGNWAPFAAVSFHVYDGATLDLHNEGGEVLHLGLVTGPGSLEKTGAGTVTLAHAKAMYDDYDDWEEGWERAVYLTDDHAFSGAVAVREGMLRIGDGSGLRENGSRVSTAFVESSAALALARSGGAYNPALSVGAAEFAPGSALFVDLAGSGSLGRMQADRVTIGAGAAFGLLGLDALAVNQTVSGTFLSAGASVAGAFEPVAYNPHLLDLSLAKSSDGQRYDFSMTRIDLPSNIMVRGGLAGANIVSAISGLERLYGNTASSTYILRDILVGFDTLSTADEVVAYAKHLARALSPETAARAMDGLQIRNASVFNSLQGILTHHETSDGALAARDVRSPDALACLDGPGGLERLAFAAPLGQWTRFSSPGAAFTAVDDFTAGVSLGAGLRRKGDFSVGGGLYYLNSDTDSGTAAIDTDTFGVNLYGRKYLNACGPRWFAEGGLGFAYGDMSQVRRTPWGRNRSDTGGQLYNVRLGTGVDVALGRAAVLTPHLGFDYNHTHTRAYTETGPTALRVDPDRLHSFQGVLGVKVRSDLGDAFFVTAGAAYRHEFADRHATLRNVFAAAPDARFVTKGFKQNRSRGEFGAGLGWQPSERISLGADYQFHLAEKQTSHSVAALFALQF